MPLLVELTRITQSRHGAYRPLWNCLPREGSTDFLLNSGETWHGFQDFLRCSRRTAALPDTASFEDVRRYQLHLAGQQKGQLQTLPTAQVVGILERLHKGGLFGESGSTLT